MKILKYILYTLIALFAIYLVLCAIGPKKFEVSRSAEINATPEAVFEEVSDFNRWSAWSPWHKYDPKMINTFSGEPGTVGHKNEWKSTEMGDGSQEIVEIVPGESVKTALRFVDFGEAVSYAGYKVETKDGKTIATWTMDGSEMPFLLRGMMLVMGAQKSMEKDYDEGLAALKKIAEAKPKTPTVSYEIVELPDQWYCGKMYPGIEESKIDSAMFATSYSELGKAIGGMEKMTGMPMSISHNYNDEKHSMDLEIAVPVAAEMKMPSGLTCGKIPGGKFIKHIYYGPYANSGMAWGALMGEVTKNHKVRWSTYEVYANDPMTVKDPSEIMTWLMVPVE